MRSGRPPSSGSWIKRLTFMDRERRAPVLRVIQEVCANRGWTLLAAHGRSNHVHSVARADSRPERVMNDFKAYASRRLNQRGIGDRSPARWLGYISNGQSTWRTPFSSRDRPGLSWRTGEHGSARNGIPVLCVRELLMGFYVSKDVRTRCKENRADFVQVI